MDARDLFAALDRAGLIALAPEIAAAVRRVGTVGDAHIAADVLKAFQRHGLSPSVNHYYSPIPDVDGLPESLWQGPSLAAGWARVDVADYRPLLRRIVETASELKALPRVAASGFWWDNPMFPPLDAMAYHGLIRERRPKRILEIGSGFSTHIATRALALNGSGEIECIEPYPTPNLLALGARVHRMKVQDAPDAMFRGLEAGDILFIDTSHVAKAGSDVNDILFRVLPLVARGVLVHIHDMMLPYEYPRSWYHDISIIWNEQYAVLALLMDSARFRVVLPNYLASHECREMLEASLRDFDIWDITQNLGGARGASLWLEVKGD